MWVPCRFKVAVLANSAILLIQLGGITIALLKVLSDMRHPDSGDTPRLRREAAFAIVSICTTVGAFCVNVLGMQSAFGMVRAAAVSISGGVRTLFSASTAAVQPMNTGAGAQSQPAQEPGLRGGCMSTGNSRCSNTCSA